MGIREDAEAMSVKYLGGDMPMGVATVVAWALVMAKILGDLCEHDSLPYRYRLALATMERWGMVLPYTDMPEHEPRLFVKEDVAMLRALFEDSYRTAILVRIFLPLLCLDDRARESNREHDEAVITTLREFCDRHVKEIDRLLTIGDQISCERGEFLALIGHLTALMRVVLGEKDAIHFQTQYDEGMAGLEQIRALAQAPPQ